MRIIRGAARATSGSWVIKISVRPCRHRLVRISIICCPDAVSRLPVGSSASRMGGEPAIARAIATKPELLLLDEPAAGMNNDECNELVEVLKKIHNELGFTVALIEHHIDFVMNLCNRLYVLNLGKILAEGTPEAVQNDPNVIKAYLGERRNGRGK